MRSLSNGILALAAALIAGPFTAQTAQAAALTFDSRTAWTAAVSAPPTVTFNQFAGNSTTDLGLSHIEGGVKFDLPNGDLNNVGHILGTGPLAGVGNGGTVKAGPFYGSGYLEWHSADDNVLPNTLLITLPTAARAFGFDFTELRGAFDTFTIEVGSETFTVDTSTEDDLFFGLTGLDPFTTIKITDLNLVGNAFLFPTIDNFSFADPVAAAVPEPASLALIGIGAASLFVRRRRRNPA
jgi:hypothetical protein